MIHHKKSLIYMKIFNKSSADSKIVTFTSFISRQLRSVLFLFCPNLL